MEDKTLCKRSYLLGYIDGKESKWVKCSDRMPEIDNDGFDEGDGISDTVLMYYTCKDDDSDSRMTYIRVGHYLISEGEETWTIAECLTWDCLPRDHEKNITVTHWMPLPEAPNE